jgi:hypothetical protein
MVDEPELVGARWWREAFDAGKPSRQNSGLGELLLISAAGMGATVTLTGALMVLSVSVATFAVLPERPLRHQQNDGWAVGAPPGELSWVSTCPTPPLDPSVLASLPQDLLPPSPYNSWARMALLQAPSAAPPPDSGQRPLAEVLQPLCTDPMSRAFLRGQALAELLAPAERERVVLLIDLPGPEAVAFAAGLGPGYAPVWTFENWPHPKGIVPAHETLGAVLYHLDALKAPRRDDARPALVLDRARRNTMKEGAFDNRYFAELPSSAKLGSAANTRVLYVRNTRDEPDASDLRSDLEAWGASHSVMLLDLDRFGEGPGPDGANRAWYGGSEGTHWHFWVHYGIPGEAPQPSVAPAVGPPDWRPPVRAVTPAPSSGYDPSPVGYRPSVGYRSGGYWGG